MSLPATPFEHFEMGNVPFRSPNWEDEFARYRWIYVRGYRDAMRACRRLATNPASISVSTLKTYIRAAPDEIPEAYRQEAPTLDWGTLSAPQIDLAIHQKTMRFDKAWLAIAALDLMCAGVNPQFDIWKYVCLCPAVFVVDGFSARMMDHLVERDLIGALQKYSFQLARLLFDEMSGGARTVTYRTAKRTTEFLAQKNLDGPFGISRIHTRQGFSPAENEAILNLSQDDESRSYFFPDDKKASI